MAQIGLALVAIVGMLAYGLWPADTKSAAPAAAAARPASGVRVLDAATLGAARTASAPAIRIASTRCSAGGAGLRKLELAGSMNGPEGARLALNGSATSVTSGIVQQCGAWSNVAALAAAAGALCTRLAGQPERSDWSLQAQLMTLSVHGATDGAVHTLVPKARVALEREVPGQQAIQTLARDEAALDCR